jgi:RNA polymerase-binding transcription factor
MSTILKNQMDKKKIERFRKRLEQEQRAIVLSIRRARLEEDKIEIGHGTDEADIAVGTFQKELALALQDSGATRLKAIRDALRRMETRQWGFCASCEEPIPETRLDAVPWATKCLGCQDRIENARRK